MANDDQIEIDSNKVDADLLASERSSQAVPVGASSILNLRTIAAGVTGAAIAALVLGAVVLFWRGDENAPIQVLQAEHSETVRPASAGVDPDEDLRVYVTGAVVNPGVYSLSQGDRVSDALAAAGGETDDAQSASINLALRVLDEGHYHIPRLGETPVADTTAMIGGNLGAAAPGICDGLIDLNTASAQLLETLPSIGEVRAAAVVSYRNANGGFQAIEDVTNVSGIGPATYEAIRRLATVCDPG